MRISSKRISYSLPVIVGGGLVIGLAARFVFAAPDVGELVFLGALLAGGGPLVVQTLRGMLRGRFAADIVAMLAIVTALVLGQYFCWRALPRSAAGSGASRWKRCP